jgi:opacity protein-like surface antigen
MVKFSTSQWHHDSLRRCAVAPFLLLAAMLVSTPAAADLAGWWNRQSNESASGVYLGLSGSVGVAVGLDDHVSVTNFRSQGARNGLVSLESMAGVGLHARVGYRFHPHFAAEGQFEWISEWTINGRDSERTNPTSSSEVGRAEAWTATANVKFYLLTGRVQPYLVGGIGLMRFQGDNRSPLIPANSRPIFELNTDGVRDYGFASRWGGGVDIYFTDQLSLVLGASYVIPEGQIDPYDYVSIEWGLQYRF